MVRILGSVVLTVLFAAGGGAAIAAPPGEVPWEARLEPADLAPGQSGVLVVSVRLGDLFVFADAELALTWAPLAGEGAQYEMPMGPVTHARKPAAVRVTPPQPMKANPRYAGWEGSLEIRVPVRVDASAPPDLEIGLSLDYVACDELNCYPRRRDQRASVKLAGAAPLAWTDLRDVDHLRREVEAAKGVGRPVVVSVWATWCSYCKRYQQLVDLDPELRDGFQGFTRLRIDVTQDDRADLRAALGMGSGQPRMVFLDRQGRIHRALDVERWYDSTRESTVALRRRMILALATLPVAQVAEAGAGEGR